MIVRVAGVTVRALWNPGWYNLDTWLKVGREAVHPFSTEVPQGLDVAFHNGLGHAFYYGSATVEAIEHAHFGAVAEVDTRPFGQYTFTFGDGRWVTIEAEESLGNVNRASPGFPVGECDPGWAENDGWALVVTLSDIERVPPPDMTASRERVMRELHMIIKPDPGPR